MKLPKKSKDTKELLQELETLEGRVAVLEEELENKIRQNMELTSQVRCCSLPDEYDYRKTTLVFTILSQTIKICSHIATTGGD